MSATYLTSNASNDKAPVKKFTGSFFCKDDEPSWRDQYPGPAVKKGRRSFTISTKDSDGKITETTIDPDTYKRVMDSVELEQSQNKRAFLAHIVSQRSLTDQPPKWLLIVKSKVMGEFETEAEAKTEANAYHLYLVRRTDDIENIYAATINFKDGKGSKAKREKLKQRRKVNTDNIKAYVKYVNSVRSYDYPPKWLVFYESKLVGEFETEDSAFDSIRNEKKGTFYIRRSDDDIRTNEGVEWDDSSDSSDSSDDSDDPDYVGESERKRGAIWNQRETKDKLVFLEYVKTNKEALNPPKWIVVDFGRIKGCYSTKVEAKEASYRSVYPFIHRSDDIESLFAPIVPHFS